MAEKQKALGTDGSTKDDGITLKKIGGRSFGERGKESRRGGGGSAGK